MRDEFEKLQTPKPRIQISFNTQNSIARKTAHAHTGETRRAWSLTLIWILSFGIWIFPSFSQLPPGSSGNNIEYPYFDKQSRRPISLLLGDEAVPQPGGLLLIKGLRIQTFDYSGNARRTNFLVSAPSCLLDVRRRIASSEGPLTAETADGSFSISGRGFQWRQIDSHLIISNSVETRLDRAVVLGSPPKKK